MSVDRAQFGNQDPDVYFYGDTIEKLEQRKYRLTRGGFTTCVQPTPRWEVTSGSVMLNLDDYAIARNMVLRVKGVPMMYLPVLYYPIQDDERATGFLLPTYGTSTLRGQAISNAFFWAIGRSQDATFVHDWFTRIGQGAGAEYRYVAGHASYGNLRFYRLDQQQTEFRQDGNVRPLPEETSYTVSGAGNQAIGTSIRLHQRVDYCDQRAHAAALSAEHLPAGPGIDVTLTPDAALTSFLPDAAAVVVGADAIADTCWINKAGTFGLAAAAAHSGVPVYVVASRDKTMPAELAGRWRLLDAPADEVWPDAPEHVGVVNRYFEPTPNGLATLFLTDAGPIAPEDIAKLIHGSSAAITRLQALLG